MTTPRSEKLGKASTRSTELQRDLASALYRGTITHVRRVQPEHSFRYSLFLLYLDLDELPHLNMAPVLGVERPGLLSFRRKDYRGSADQSLKQTVLDDVERATGERPRGPVRLLTHVRSLGRAFNPVGFYYCFAEDGESLQAVVAEITNTPWGERHAYVIPGSGVDATRTFPKTFHVSPFLPMQQEYVWALSKPSQALTVEMCNHAEGQETFRARLALTRAPLTRGALLASALLAPLMGVRVLLYIYWHALLLCLKKAPFFTHPRKMPHTPARNEA